MTLTPVITAAIFCCVDPKKKLKKVLQMYPINILLSIELVDNQFHQVDFYKQVVLSLQD
jgi:hypothetical protein